MSMYQDIPVPLPDHRRKGSYSDLMRLSVRHYKVMAKLAEAGSFDTLNQLLAAILDAALPRVKLIARPQYDVVITDEPDQEE